MPEKVDECVDAVMRDNPDMAESRAFAICNAMKNRGDLASETKRREVLNALQEVDTATITDVDSCELDLENKGIEEATDLCKAMLGHDLSAPTHSIHDLAEVQDPGTIERVDEGGAVRYTDILLLAPGVWGDAGSGQRVYYSPDGIENSADNWSDTTVNLFHERENEVTDVGDVDTDSLYLGDDAGGLYGDIVLHMDNPASEFADEALQNALETGGREGIQGPSVELRGLDYEFNEAKGVHELVHGEFNGLGLVGLGVSPGPGSKDAAFAKQTRERAVALADDDGATLLTHEPMSTDTLRDELTDNYDIQLGEDVPDDAVEALAETLLQGEGEFDLVQDLIEQARQEGFDLGDQSAAELRSFITDTLDPSEDALAAFDDIADAYLEVEEAESLDVTPAEGMLDYILEQAEGDEPEDGDGGDEPDEMAQQLADLEASIEGLEDRLSTLAEETEPFREADTTLSDLTERFDDYASADAVEEIDSRLSELEDTLEAPTSLADGGGAETTEADDDTTPEPWAASQVGRGRHTTY